MKNTAFVPVLLSLLLLFSCGPSQREMAVRQISQSQMMLEQGDTLGAIGLLDSVRQMYPKAEVQHSVSRKLIADLYQQMIDKRQLQLIRKDSLIIELESDFIKEKTEFDKYTQYRHKRQSLSRSWDRSFLQVHLDERGEIYLSSNYMGDEWLEHTGIRVYDGELQAKSEKIPIEDPLNHRSDFLDYKWEKVSYMNGKADSVIQFIATHPKLDLKCVFLGKRYYYILLEDFDIAAVSEALQLSEAIKTRKQLHDEINSYTQQRKKYRADN
ncbi:hypothetical protein [Roseimarinus sediminis]|uniref:hypothetical protein n=1 Tax=Roseimarinus sediminis TaxID=1610899 RepID=UPI003D1D0998